MHYFQHFNTKPCFGMLNGSAFPMRKFKSLHYSAYVINDFFSPYLIANRFRHIPDQISLNEFLFNRFNSVCASSFCNRLIEHDRSGNKLQTNDNYQDYISDFKFNKTLKQNILSMSLICFCLHIRISKTHRIIFFLRSDI